MAEVNRFLVLSLEGESYAISIARLVEISVPRDIQKDKSLTEIFEGKFEYRGRLIPVINMKKIFKLPGGPGAILLVLKSAKGEMGVLVDSVTEIMETDKKPIPMPRGVVNPSLPYYQGMLRRDDRLILLLNEDGLLA